MPSVPRFEFPRDHPKTSLLGGVALCSLLSVFGFWEANNTNHEQAALVASASQAHSSSNEFQAHAEEQAKAAQHSPDYPAKNHHLHKAVEDYERALQQSQQAYLDGQSAAAQSAETQDYFNTGLIAANIALVLFVITGIVAARDY